jgi:cysteinyl-tRNA synthetase
MRIYNTMSGQAEEFQPIGDPVKMYVCGVTPYDSSHIGHAMSYINFDVIRRYLEFRGYNVYMVQNFTDVDDKLIARASRLGTTVRDLAEKHIAEFIADMVALNVKPPSLYVRATDTIPTIVEFTSGLVEKGNAYAAGGDVYFRISSDDDYGQLSHRSLDDIDVVARVDADEQKEHPMDFALWKSAKPGEPSWDSPWGKGRPGWHIECSAMILKHLGTQIDIHGGGHDLIFPHHENEIAQSESYTGCKPFVKYWIHNGLLQFGKGAMSKSEKMSKSLGNIVSIKDALADASPDGLRMLYLTSHYRGPLNYSYDGLIAAEKGVERLRAAVAGLPESAHGRPEGTLAESVAHTREQFISAMDEDFNCASAVSALFDLARDVNRAREDGRSEDELAPAGRALRDLAGILGFTLVEPKADLAAQPFIDLLVDVRTELRALKQWALADKVRNRLNDLGVAIEDRADGTTWKASRTR